MSIQGIWLPIITPFLNGQLDLECYETMLRDYLAKGIAGIIPLATTGESPVITKYEFEAVLEKTIDVVNGAIPIFAGLGSNNTGSVTDSLKTLEKYNIDGILSTCPYYNRPNQRGLFQHFQKISEATDLDIMIYNIPYRTSVNLENETLLRLAELKNIVAVKDCSGNINQSLELLMEKPEGFSVLTGDDGLFYTTLVHGGDGAVSASAHFHTETFVEIHKLIRQNNHQDALKKWNQIAKMIPLLFAEPNPVPVKYGLFRSGKINSPEVRLPLVEASEEVKEKLNTLFQ